MTVATLPDTLTTFTTIFLGIFIEAAPFLMLGTLISGLVEVFFNQGDFSRFVPRNPFLAALAGAGMGLVFPVCECGVVPLARPAVGLPSKSRTLKGACTTSPSQPMESGLCTASSTKRAARICGW